MYSLEVSVLAAEEDPLLAVELAVSAADRLILENPLQTLPDQTRPSSDENN